MRTGDHTLPQHETSGDCFDSSHFQLFGGKKRQGFLIFCPIDPLIEESAFPAVEPVELHQSPPVVCPEVYSTNFEPTNVEPGDLDTLAAAGVLSRDLLSFWVATKH